MLYRIKRLLGNKQQGTYINTIVPGNDGFIGNRLSIGGR